MQGRAAGSDPQWDLQEPHFHVIGRGGQFLVLRHIHAWQPPTDVMADEDRLTVIVEIAGMKDGEFQVALDSRRLVVTGTRLSREEPHAAYHQLEVRYGEFRTEVFLPWPIDEDKIVARYEDGYLRVELPRATTHPVRIVGVDKSE